MQRLSRLPVLLVLLLVLAACGGGRRTAAAGPASPDQARTTVRVENQNFLDMNVYVLNGTQRVRLGTVPGLTTRVFPIPQNLVFGISSLRFQADPVGANRAPISQEISVQAGDQVILTIPNY